MTVIINGSNTPTAGAVAVGDGTTLNFTAAGTAGQILQSNGASVPTWINNDAGTVTSASVVSANGFAGTVANASTTPEITLSTSITGVIKGNGTALSAATAGTDYCAATSGSGILKGSSGNTTTATAGTDYVAPATATSFTATQTFSGSSTTLATILKNAAETTTVSATASSGTIAYDVLTQSVLFYTTNASGNWTMNIRGSSGTSLNTLMTTGQTLTVVFMAQQGSTAYYQTGFQIDGNSVTPKWQGGTAPSSGNASSIDVYTYTIIKTGSATYTVFVSQTKFA